MRYAHLFSMSFELVSEDEDANDISGADLRTAVLRRLDLLSDEDLAQTIDAPYDTTPEEDEDVWQ